MQTFRDKANGVCVEAGAAIGEAFQAGEPTPEQLQSALDTVVTVSRSQFDDIEALDAPASIEDDVDAMLAEGRAATDVAEAQGVAFFANEDDPWAKAGEMAADLGLDACSPSE